MNSLTQSEPQERKREDASPPLSARKDNGNNQNETDTPTAAWCSA